MQVGGRGLEAGIDRGAGGSVALLLIGRGELAAQLAERQVHHSEKREVHGHDAHDLRKLATVHLEAPSRTASCGPDTLQGTHRTIKVVAK